MEQKKVTVFQHALVYGLILGLALIVYSILLYMINMTFNIGLSLISWVIIIIGITLGTKAYRDKVLGGTISYGNALGTGILIVLVAGAVSAIFNYILTTIIDPGLMDKYFQIVEERLAKRGMSDDQIELFSARMRESSSPLKTMIFGIVGFAFFGTIISLITSAFLKKESDPFGSQQTLDNQ